MATNGILGLMNDFFANLTGKNRFGKFDFGVLKTMMMLSAVDGNVSAEELERFRKSAAECRGYNGESFETLWESALRSAGYLLLQSKFLKADELVKVFVKEAEKEFTGEVIQEVSKDRERAFAELERMAKSDGEYSEIERACVTALAARVKEARDQAIAERYSRATTFDK